MTDQPAWLDEAIDVPSDLAPALEQAGITSELQRAFWMPQAAQSAYARLPEEARRRFYRLVTWLRREASYDLCAQVIQGFLTDGLVCVASRGFVRTGDRVTLHIDRGRQVLVVLEGGRAECRCRAMFSPCHHLLLLWVADPELVESCRNIPPWPTPQPPSVTGARGPRRRRRRRGTGLLEGSDSPE